MSGAAADELTDAIAVLREVGPEGAGHGPAIAAWEVAASAPPERLADLLIGLDGANPLAANWIRSAFETVVDQQITSTGTLPLADLIEYLEDRQHSPAGRRLAFEWIVRIDPSRRDAFVATMLDDPSLELRREAVADLLTQAAAMEGSPEALPLYRQALNAARDQDQVADAAAQIEAMGHPVDLATHFGLITHWQLIGPFDHVADRGFQRVYPPEQHIDLTETLEGKHGPVTWQQHSTDDPYGAVDLNLPYDNEKGAVVYAYASFESTEVRQVELRLGCINGHKVWLNGELLISHEIYHTGILLDQYAGRATLQEGTNHILLKICQNEQEEYWAQQWAFQLRVCDPGGTAVLSADRENSHTPPGPNGS